MSPITVGLAGITGKFGGLLASQLLQNEDVLLRGHARDLSKVEPSLASSPRVTLFKGEALDDDSIRPFVAGCNVIVCAYLGPDELMVDDQKKLVDACEEAGVPRYVASDWELDYTKLKLGELFPKHPMIHVRAHLQAKNKVQGVHVLIGGYMDPLLSPFFNLCDPQSRTLQFWGEGTEPWEGTSYANAAEFTAAVVVDRSAVGIQKYLDDRKTIKEIAAAFQKVYGFQPTLKRLGSLEDLKARMCELQARDPADVFSYICLFFTHYWLNGQTFVGPDTDNAKFPEVKPETWEDFLSKRKLEDLAHVYFSLAK